MRKPPSDDPEDIFEFELLADRFESKPTLANYLKIRERFPTADIVWGEFGSVVPIYDIWTDSLDGREHFGIHLGHVIAAANGCPKGIDDLCIALGKAWQKGIELKRAGKTHSVGRRQTISKATVNYLVSIVLEAAATQGTPVPPSLAMLFREMEVGSNPALFQRVMQEEKRFRILLAAFENQRDFGSILSFGKLSEKTKIPKNTISQIFDGEENFMRELADFSDRRRGEPIDGHGVPNKS